MAGYRDKRSGAWAVTVTGRQELAKIRPVSRYLQDLYRNAPIPVFAVDDQAQWTRPKFAVQSNKDRDIWLLFPGFRKKRFICNQTLKAAFSVNLHADATSFYRELISTASSDDGA